MNLTFSKASEETSVAGQKEVRSKWTGMGSGGDEMGQACRGYSNEVGGFK